MHIFKNNLDKYNKTCIQLSAGFFFYLFSANCYIIP